jgi:hypothetical protein
MTETERQRETGDRPAALPDDDTGDFADEHADTSVSGQLEGGPEHAPEPESPEGRAGMDE